MAGILTLTTPLMRQTVGFDRFNDLFESILEDSPETFDAYPPYNIEKHGDDEYRIVMAVAGFDMDDLNIIVEDAVLTISGQIEERSEDAVTYLHRGIAGRSFEKKFQLADHIKVEEAEMKGGLLTVHLVREIPEEKKPKMIPIKAPTKLLGSSKKRH